MELDQSASPAPNQRATHVDTDTMTTDETVKAFKRAPSVEMSTWYKGILISNLATEQDTDGAFELVVTKMREGTEPPPHVYERENEMFYVLEGMIDVYVGDKCFRALTNTILTLTSFAHWERQKMFWLMDQNHPMHFVLIAEVVGRTESGNVGKRLIISVQAVAIWELLIYGRCMVLSP